MKTSVSPRAALGTVLLTVLALSAAANPTSGQPRPSPAPSAAALREATVMIEATDPHGRTVRGTGAIVDTEGAILTARSLVARAVRVRARFANGNVAPARLVASAELADLALLHADTKRRAPWRLGDTARVRANEEVGVVSLPERRVHAGGDVTFSLVTVRGPSQGDMVWPFATATTPESDGAIVLNRDGEMIGVAFRASRLLRGRAFFVSVRAAAPLLSGTAGLPAWLASPAGGGPAAVSHPYFPAVRGSVREGDLVLRAGRQTLLRAGWRQTTDAVEPGPFGTLVSTTLRAGGESSAHQTLISPDGVRDVDPYAPPIRNFTPRVLLPAAAAVGPFAAWEGIYDSANRRVFARAASRVARAGFAHAGPAGTDADCLETRTETFFGPRAFEDRSPDVVREAVYCRGRGPVQMRERRTATGVEIVATLRRVSDR